MFIKGSINAKEKAIKKATVIFLIITILLSNLSGMNTLDSIFKIIEANASYPLPLSVDESYVFLPSSLDNLKLNISTLPEITHEGSSNVVITDKEVCPYLSSNKVTNRLVEFFKVPYDFELDDVITVFFDSCGSLNEKSIDMKLIYSDFVSSPADSNSNTKRHYLDFTAYGTPSAQTSQSGICNEWWDCGFQTLNLKIYFYYHGETQPIHLESAYLTFYSEDGDSSHRESTCSSLATNSYLSTRSRLINQEEVTLHSKTFTNVLCGTAYAGTNNNGKYSATGASCYRFENTDYLDANILVLRGTSTTSYDCCKGYHLNFCSLFNSSVLVQAQNKIDEYVNKTEAYLDDEIEWNIVQKFPSNLKQTSELLITTNINVDVVDVTSVNLIDNLGNDVTDEAGNITQMPSPSSPCLIYVFSSQYLQNITNKGQVYKLVVKGKAKENLSSFIVYSNSQSVLNNVNAESETVSTEILYKINTKLTGKGTITGVVGSDGGSDSILGIKGDSSNTISWLAENGYYVSSVKIDGVSQPISDTSSGSYTFNNISANHSVEVVTTEIKYQIDTKLTGKGTITGVEGTNGGTGSIANITRGTDKTITWSAAEGYYVSSIKIDGVEQEINTYLTNGSKAFNNIVENHTVEVITEPRPEFIITKTVDKSYYNANDIVDFTISFKLKDNTASKAYDVILEDIDMTEGVTLVSNSITVSGVDSPRYTLANNGVFKLSMPYIDKDETVTINFKGKLENSYVNSLNENITNNMTNTARVTSDGIITSGNDETWESATVVTPVLKPVVSIIKNSDKEKYNVGDTVTYQITVNQTKENAIAHNVIVTDNDYTKGITMTLDSEDDIQVTDAQGIALDPSFYSVSITNKESFEITITKLKYNQPVIISVKGIITQNYLAGQSFSNTAEVTCENNSNVVSATANSFVYAPNVKVFKLSDKDYYNVGDEINYTVEVKQTTENAIANNVIVTDVVPNGLKLNESSIQSSANANISYNENSRTITVALKQGLTNSFTIAYSAIIENDNLAGKNIVNTAVVDWSNNPNNDKPEGKSTVSVLLPVLTVSKNSGKNGTTYNVKDTLPFEVIVKQTTKKAVANDVVISDRMAVADIDVNIDSVNVYNANGDLLIKDTDYTLVNQYDKTTHKSGFDIKLVSLSDQVRITYDAVINNNNVAGKSVSNHVVVTASNNQGEQPTARSEEPIPEPFVKVEKKSDKTHYNVGDIALFTITVNQIEENARANDVVITDEMIEDGVSLSYESVKVFFNDNEITPEITQTEKGFVIPVGNITDNDNVIIKYSATVMDNELSGHDFSNDASTIWANNPSNPDGTKTTSESYVLKPQLLIEKAIDNNKPFNVGDKVDYTVTVSIDSEKTPEARANNVVITDKMLEDGVAIDFDSLYLDEYAKGQYDLDVSGNSFKVSGIGHLNDGETLTIHYQAKIVDPALVGKDFNNTATATCDNNPEIVEDDANGSIVTPKLEILKDIEFENYNLSDVVNYTITVNQLVPHARANDVVITDILDTDGIEIIPDSIELVSGSDITVLPVSESDIAPVTVSESDKVVSKSDLASASSNGFVVKTSAVEKSFVIKYQAKIADKNLMGESFTNKAYVTSSNYLDKDNEPVIEKASVTANVYEPVLSIEKTSDRYTYNLYDIVHFNVKVTQTVENAVARGVVINDSFINQGVEIDPDTIVVKNFLPEDYEITQSGNGYEIAFNVPILYNQLIEIEYDAKIMDSKLVDCILEHDIYTSCVTNVNTTGVWHDDVAIEVLKPDIMITKISDKSEAYGNEIVKYTVTITQTVQDANSFNLVVNDVIEDNMLIDTKSIEFSSSDITLDISEIEVAEKDNGFVAYIPYIRGENSVAFTYKAKILDEAFDTSTNVASVTGDTLKDGIEAKATINILKAPVTGEADTLPIAMSIAFVSLGVFVGLAHLKRRQYVSFDA